MSFQLSGDENSGKCGNDELSSPFATTCGIHTFDNGFIEDIGLTTSFACVKMAIRTGDLSPSGFIECEITNLADRIGHFQKRCFIRIKHLCFNNQFYRDVLVLRCFLVFLIRAILVFLAQDSSILGMFSSNFFIVAMPNLT